MKKVFAYSILAILVLAGCQVKELEVETTNEQDVLPVLESKPFVAIIEDDSVGNETKTTLDNSGNVLWKQGDQVSIFAGSTVNECYQVTDESEGKTSAALNKISGTGSGSAIENNVAFYPYASAATISKSGSNYVISGIELPATQDYSVGSFGNGAFSMAAITSTPAEMNLTFKNVLGGLKLQLKGTATIASIAVTGNNDEILCGDAEVTVSTASAPSINLTDVSAKVVTLDCGAGVTLDSETATSFIIALPPMTMTGGFTVVVTDTEGKEMEIKTTREQTIPRSSLLKMPVVTYSGIARFAYLGGSGDLIGITRVPAENITSVNFYTNSSKTTDFTPNYTPEGYETVYCEIDGTTVNFYTRASRIQVDYPANFFNGCTSLTSIDISSWDTHNATDFQNLFNDCLSLQEINLGYLDTSNGEIFQYMFGNCNSLARVDGITDLNTGKATNLTGMFSYCTSLSALDLSLFNTSQVTTMSGMFEGCRNLIDLNISGFSSDVLSNAFSFLAGCCSLRKLNLGLFDLSNVENVHAACLNVARLSKNCAILCSEETKNTLCSGSTHFSYKNYVTWVLPGETLPDLPPYINPDLYYSSDFSKDKTVKVLQSATEGQGIDVVLIGEGFSDRLINDGTYDTVMNNTMEAIFQKEPYSSFRNLFNVYLIYAVSENEVTGESTAFGIEFEEFSGESSSVSCFEDAIFEYATSAVGKQRMSADVQLFDTGIIVVVNDSSSGGISISHNHFNFSEYYDYPTAHVSYAIVRGAKLDGVENFQNVVSHEFAHAFARLADEYVDKDSEIPEWEKNSLTQNYEHIYQYSNIDFVNDPSEVRWSRFLNDPRYAGSGIGVFEGGFHYSKGVYRPTEDSAMGYDLSLPFNAPSREAIYRRIHKLAYGDSWSFDFDTFVNYDLPNIEADKARL